MNKLKKSFREGAAGGHANIQCILLIIIPKHYRKIYTHVAIQFSTN